MVLPEARPGRTSSFAVLARRNNQNRMAIGVGMVSHALRAGLTLLRSADGAQVAALGNQGHRRQSRHIYGPTFTRSSPPAAAGSVQCQPAFVGPRVAVWPVCNVRGAKINASGGAILRHMKVEEIAEVVAKLPPDQLARFRRWFIAFEAGRSDHAEELDSTATKLGRLAGRTFAELKKRAKKP
jgi:hypothetical protein